MTAPRMPRTRTGRAGLAVLLIGLLLLPSAFAQSGIEETGPVSSYASIDGVSYFLAAGMVNGTWLASDPGTGETLMGFTGCSFVQLRPEMDRGRVSIAGLVDGFTPFRAEINDFAGAIASQGPIATNLSVDQAYHPVLPAGQSARVEAVGQAVADVKASEVWDPMDERFVPVNFTDPVSGAEELGAAIAVSRDGIRDDETGARLDTLARDEEELHIVLSSPGGGGGQRDQFQVASPAELPDGSLMPTAEYFAIHEFYNSRFGGTGSVALTFESKAPPTFNAITVSLRAPDGTEVGNATLESSAVAAGTATLDFAADQIGFYSFLVTGKVLLSNYRFDVTLAAPAAFQMDFWWEEVRHGVDAQNAFGECQRAIGLRAQVVAGRVERSPPPLFPLEVVIGGIAGTVIVALLVVKLMSEQVTADSFRKIKK